jgi:hypothetical protein
MTPPRPHTQRRRCGAAAATIPAAAVATRRVTTVYLRATIFALFEDFEVSR